MPGSPRRSNRATGNSPEPRRRDYAARALRVLFALWCGLALLALARPAQATLRSVVEVDEPAAQLLDVQVTRRLIQLELREIDLDLGEAVQGGGPPVLYFRIFAISDAVLSIELWDRGRFFGERRVSAQGSALLRARRLALASAELARLAKKLLARENARKERARRARNDEPEGALSLPASVRLTPAVHGALVDDGKLWLIGPRLATALVLHGGPRLDLGLGWHMGALRQKGGNATVSWSEVSLAPAYGWTFARHGFDLGASVAVSAVSAHDVVIGQGTNGSLHTWSAQLALLLRHHLQLAPFVRLSTGAELGHLLHPIELPSGSEVNGFWFGLNLGVELTALGRDRGQPLH